MGNRLSPETKRGLIEAIGEARRCGFGIKQACVALGLARSRLYRWLRGNEPEHVTPSDLADHKPGPVCAPHALLSEEKECILTAAREERYAHLRPVKLAHALGREGRVTVSGSTVRRVLKEADLVAPRRDSQKSKAVKPEVQVIGPNQAWHYDLTYLAVGDVFMYLIAILDHYSRKIVGWALSPDMTAAAVKAVWDRALVGEGLLDRPGMAFPVACSDRGAQMRAKSLREFFNELGISQLFSRPRTPTDNAYIESFFATVKCEGPGAVFESYEEALRALEVFVEYYNTGRLHGGIDFVTPDEYHRGLGPVLVAQRKEALKEARERRMQLNRQLTDRELPCVA